MQLYQVEKAEAPQMMIDSRGKALVQGGRAKVAHQAQFLRRAGAGNTAARAYITSAKLAYLEAGKRWGWTYGQESHNRLVPIR